MANNKVQTDFVVNASDAFRQIDQYAAKLKSLESLAVNPTFGGNVPLATENLKSLKESLAVQNSLAQAEIKNEQLKRATLATEKATFAVESARLSLAAKQEKAVGAASKLTQNPADRAVRDYFDGIQKKTTELSASAKSLQKDFASVTAQRLDSGNAGNLTKELVKASERSRQLQTDIVQLKREIADPNRKSSIGSLADELRIAEKEADQLNRKLNSLPASGGRQGGLQSGAGGNLRLSGFQKTNLSYQVNDVLTGLASGQNPSQILAQQGGQIAQIFSAQQITAFTAAYGSLVTVLGAGAAAIALTYKITGDLRTEAERRLKVENDITAAVNKQILSANELARSFAEERANAARADSFGQFTKSNSIEELQARKKALEEIVNLTRNAEATGGKTGDSKALTNDAINARRELLAIDQRLRDVAREKDKSASDSFNQSFINSEKSNNDRLESEKRYNARLKDYNEKRAAEAKKANDKLNEDTKRYVETFDSLFVLQSRGNPIAVAFSEGEKALDKLRENLKGLPSDPQNAAIGIQNNINSAAVFSARLDNNLSAFDYREKANELRNFKPRPDSPVELAEFHRIVQNSILRDNSYGSNLVDQLKRDTKGNSEISKEQERSIYEVALLSQPAFQATRIRSSFTNLSRASLISSLASERLALANPDENLSAQARLDKQLSIIDSLKAKTPEEQAIADRKALSISSNLRPDHLTDSERSKLITINEREAVRRESYERQAQELRREQAGYLKEIRDQNKTGGKQAIDINLKNSSSFEVDAAPALAPTPTAKKTEEFYGGFNQLDFQNPNNGKSL